MKIDPSLLGQQPVRALADGDLPLDGVRLSLFVERHDDDARTVGGGGCSLDGRGVGVRVEVLAADVDAAVAAMVAELDPPSDVLASAAHRRSIAASLLRRVLDPDVTEAAA